VSQQINLYNPALAPKVQVLSGRRLVIALAGVVVVCLLVWVAAEVDADRLARAERTQAAQLAQLQAEMTALAQRVAARKPSAQLQADLQNLEALRAARGEVMALLASGRLGDTRGVSEYLRAFARQTTEGLWLTGLSIAQAGNDIVIQGRTRDADLVPLYLQKLRRETALRGHGFESLSVSQPQSPPGSAAAAPPGYLEFRMATSDHDSATDTRTASKPGGAR
jgi:Tfp pilus assembly protein PilN